MIGVDILTSMGSKDSATIPECSATSRRTFEAAKAHVYLHLLYIAECGVVSDSTESQMLRIDFEIIVWLG